MLEARGHLVRQLRPRRVPQLTPVWLILPAVAYLALFFVWPLGVMVAKSFTDPHVGLGNYQRFFQTPAMTHSLWVTIKITLVSTIVCAVLGYVYAYCMVHGRPAVRRALLVLVALPAALNLLVRTFALEVILQDQGLVNRLLRDIGLTDHPLSLIRTPFAIGFGMVSLSLPFMVYPIYSAMRRIDPDLMFAAHSLGAGPSSAFRRVFLPLSMPGLAAGSLIVFVTGLGYYVVPQVLGNNGSDQFISQHVAQYASDGQWGFSAAIGVILMAITLGIIGLAARMVRVGDIMRSSVGGQ
jgi:putative spermidine/putrescine transport system permease protein